MTNESQSPSLAERRAALVARCAEQRGRVAAEYTALKSPSTLGGVTGFVAEHRRSALIAGGVAAALLIMRPKWVAGTGAAITAVYKTGQHYLPLVQRYLPVLREYLQNRRTG